MTKETEDYVTKEAKALVAVPFACKEAKEVCTAWLNAKGTDKEKEASLAMVKELKEDIVPVDGLIEFASSAAALKEFGGEEAKTFLAHAKKLKKEGQQYCDCPACTAAQDILAKEEEILA